MTFISKFDRYITAIYLLTIITIVATSYFTFKEFFTSHSQRQQEAIIPLYSLVTNKIIRPLTVAQYMASDQFLINHSQQEKIDKKFLSQYLLKISKQFKILSFIALEKHNFMLDSTNKSRELSNINAEWFYRLKAIDKKQFADIGNASDPHLYFDIKLENDQQDFLGFVGVGVDLTAFAKLFSQFYQQYGFELYFVDENDIIALSSNNLMKSDNRHREKDSININSLPWYQHYLAKQQQHNTDSFNSYTHNTSRCRRQCLKVVINPTV